MIYRASAVPSTIYIYCARDMPCCCCSVAQSCPTLRNPMDCRVPDFPVLHHLLELVQLMSTESVMPSNHLILCCFLLLLPSIFPSIRVISNESLLPIKWPKYMLVENSNVTKNERKRQSKKFHGKMMMIFKKKIY